MVDPAQWAPVHRPVLRAVLPDGWAVSERTTFESPAGTAVDVHVGRAPTGCTAAVLADRLVATAPAGRAQVRPAAASVVALGNGRVAEDRRFAISGDATDQLHRLICVVDGDLAVVLRASWDASNDAASRDVDDAVAALRRLPGGPSDAGGPMPAPGRPARPRGRPPVDAAEWSTLRAAWSASEAGRVQGIGAATRWSQAELSVCATILGSTTFPTIGYGIYATHDASALSATIDAVTRSFIARGLVGATAAGTELTGGLGHTMELATDPDLVVDVEHLDALGTRHTWFGVRPDGAVRVTSVADGSREVGELEPGGLVAAMLHHVGMGVGTTSPADPSTMRVTRDAVAAGDGRIAALVGVTTGWRADAQIHGGTLAFAVDVDGVPWHAEPVADAGGGVAFELCRTDPRGLRDVVLAHLPGG